MVDESPVVKEQLHNSYYDGKNVKCVCTCLRESAFGGYVGMCMHACVHVLVCVCIHV